MYWGVRALLEASTHAKIADLEDQAVRNQHVAGGEIAVNKGACLEKLHPAGHVQRNHQTNVEVQRLSGPSLLRQYLQQTRIQNHYAYC